MFREKLTQILEKPSDQQEFQGSGSPQQFITFKKLLDGGGYPLGFSGDGQGIYMISRAGELVSVDLNSGDREVNTQENIPEMFKLIDACGGDFLIETFEAGKAHSDLMALNMPRARSVLVSDNSWGGAWSSGCDELAYIHADGGHPELWQQNTLTKRKQRLVDLSAVYAPLYVDWSGLGNRLLVQGVKGLAIYSVDNRNAIQINWIPDAKDSSWSPDGWHIIYRLRGGEEDSLWIANLDGNEEEVLWEGVFSNAEWTPDGDLLFFIPGKQSGAACWRLDPNTKAKELIADSETIFWKPIDTFAVSPEGNSIIFLAQDGNLWLLEF